MSTETLTTHPAPPTGTADHDRQQADAFAASLRVKRLRSDLRRELKQPDIPTEQRLAILADAIRSCPDWLQKLDLYKLLAYGPGIGEEHARWLIEAKLGIHRRPLLREVTQRQRDALASLVMAGRHDFISAHQARRHQPATDAWGRRLGVAA